MRVCEREREKVCARKRERERERAMPGSTRLLMVPLFRGNNRFGSLVSSHHPRFTCECNQEKINDDDDDASTPANTCDVECGD